MLAHRLRRRANIKPPLDLCAVSAQPVSLASITIKSQHGDLLIFTNAVPDLFV